MMRGSNMGILPYWPNILLITWGLLLHKAGSLFFFTSCVVTRSCSMPAFVHITLVNRNTDRRPRSPDYISNAAADSFVRTGV